MSTNENKAANSWGLRCPACHSTDDIDIAATVWVRLCPDGTDPDLARCGDHEWSDADPAKCNACGFDGRVRQFEPGCAGFPTNADRAQWAAQGVRGYAVGKEGRDDYDEAELILSDFLTDLMHYADREGINFSACLKRARSHHREEIHEERSAS